MLNALSFDVEDWYQVESFRDIIKFEDWDEYESRVVENTLKILDILDKADTKATFFVLGWIAERYPELVREIDRRGHEVASHSYAHKLVFTQTTTEFERDLKKSINILEGIIHKKILGYRAPGWSITKDYMWALDILTRNGIKYDSSIYPIHIRHGTPNSPRFPYKIRKNLWEIPLPTIRLFDFNIPFGGGLFFRAVPYVFTKWGIKQVNSSAAVMQCCSYAVESNTATQQHSNTVAPQHSNTTELQHCNTICIYLHPWEFDLAQPKLKVGLKKQFIHYFNIKTTEEKFLRLLNEFQFAPIKEML